MAVGIPGRVRADSSLVELLRAPASVRQTGAGGLYGEYDVFKAFENPALIANQARTWQFGMSNALGQGASAGSAAVAAGWASGQSESGSFGAALMASGWTMASIEELDLSGDPTGVVVSPSAMHAALAVVYQWKFFSLGFGGHVVMGSLSGLTGDQPELIDGALDLGTTFTLGRVDLGAAGRLGGNLASRIQIGLGIRTGDPFPALISADFSSGFGGDGGGSSGSGGSAEESSWSYGQSPQFGNLDGPGEIVSAGITWYAHRHVHVRAGISAHQGLEARAGVSVPWERWMFDYAAVVPVGAAAGLGSSHLLGLTFALGDERKLVVGPKFLIGEAERTIAVANFDPQGVSATDAAIISDMLRSRLIKEGAFNVIEKANMDKVLQEQAFQQTGCTTSECAVKLGKILNVKYLVVGSFGKLLDRYVVSMRVVDIETAKGVYSDEASAVDVPAVQEAISRLAINLTEAVKATK